MKKLMAVMLIAVMFLYSNIYVWAEVHPTETKIDTYYIRDERFDDFYNFVEKSEGNIREITQHENKYITYEVDDRKCVETRFYTDDYERSKGAYTYEDDVYGWDNWVMSGEVIGVINPEIIKYLGNKDNIKDLFAKNNVNCTINDYMIISVSYDIPAVIYVDTDRGKYYIMFEYDYPSDRTNLDYENENRLAFEVYNSNEFIKVLSYQDAEIIVDNKKISNNYYSKIRGNVAKFSLRTVLEALGSMITWDNENEVMYFTCGTDKYMMEMNDNGQRYDRVKMYDGKGYTGVFWSERIVPDMIDDRIVVTQDEIKYFAGLFGKSVTVDFKNLCIKFE